ncbi:Flap-structured DNA-binding and RNA-binding protein [Coniosporium apollinis]|uniref:RNA-binding protein VTS1 n=2 Tax=Coniosporium TaxID=2810619 RepID=A0ABQ9NXK2_9PEZI|nr:Flap-structured DNA-binding and RNA-binding protein [Cladosporium sp. JES 115]KAJ9666468.1 Flap-structured DNA-binding and RNA-binding protein [Coniosporium apollinis]
MGAFSNTPLANRGIRPSSEVYFGQSHSSQNQGNEDAMDRAAQQWIADIDQYEITLEEMATATLDQDFKDELSAIEQWFRVLSEAERTAALYQLLQQTTQVQIRFFIQVLQQMAKTHPISGVLSPANFGEKDPMSQRLSDAMSKLNVEGSRNSIGLGRPPPSPGNKRNSGLDPATINQMFPDAAAAIAKQKAEFTQHTGAVPTSNRNSTIGDRSSLLAPTISAPEDTRKENTAPPPSSPWGPRSTDAQRPKSSSGQPPMGQFTQPPPSAGGLRSPRPLALQSDSNLQSTSISAPDNSASGMSVLSPYAGSGNWASMVNTPMVPNFSAQQSANQADMVANATAMKLAALSTVNNRIQLDDVRKYRRARSTEGNNPGLDLGSGLTGVPSANFIMTNELGHVLSPQQAAALQAQQLAAMQGRRSRPSSPGLAMAGSLGGMGSFAIPQNNGFLSAYDGSSPLANNNLTGMNLAQFGIGLGGGHEGYLSDHSEIQRGRSPRGRRGSSKPPEDPTDLTLLKDIPNWLRTLRLHKYTDNLKDLKWTELIELDDEGLEKRGVQAVGARRKMLKVFEQVKEAQANGTL